MKLARAKKDNLETYGIVKDDSFFCAKFDTKKHFPTLEDFIIAFHRKINSARKLIYEFVTNFEARGHPLSLIELLTPIAEKNKIICVGINYPKLYNDKPTNKPSNVAIKQPKNATSNVFKIPTMAALAWVLSLEYSISR